MPQGRWGGVVLVEGEVRGNSATIAIIVITARARRRKRRTGFAQKLPILVCLLVLLGIFTIITSVTSTFFVILVQFRGITESHRASGEKKERR